MTAGTFDRDGYWSSAFINTDTLAYNPTLLKAARLRPPESWVDFTKPEWSGKFALFSGSLCRVGECFVSASLTAWRSVPTRSWRSASNAISAWGKGNRKYDTGNGPDTDPDS